MPEVVERKFKGDKVKFEIVRDKKPMKLTIELDTVWPYQMQAHHYDTRPRYIVYGGLIFQPLSLDLLDAYQMSDPREIGRASCRERAEIAGVHVVLKKQEICV